MTFGVLLLVISLGAQSPVVISGRVVTGDPPSPVTGAVVTAGASSATTDRDGRFTLTIAGGATTGTTTVLRIAAPGYLDEAVDAPIGGAPVTITLRLAPRVNEDVEVSAGVETAPPPPVLEVTPAAVRSVAGANDNVFRVLSTLPGVSATNDIDSRLSVRGGGPDQNLTIMDGVEIHNPYRLFGLTSAFNPETIDRFDLTAGGFGPQYGDRLSSILVIENRAGNRTRSVGGSAALSLTDANIVLEGRLPRRANGSWLLTGRRTYYDIFAERVTHNDLPSFADVQGKVVWSPGRGRELTLFGLRSRERTDATISGSNPGDRFGLDDASSNDVVSVSLASPLGTRAASKTTVSWYRYADALDVDGSARNEGARSNSQGDDAFQRATIVFARDVGARDIALRHNITAVAGRSHALDVGVEAHALRTNWGWRISGDRNSSEANGSSALGGRSLPNLLESSATSVRVGAWIEDAFRVGPRAHIAAGLRVDWSGLATDTPISPRLRATFDLTPRTRLKAAGGLYTQSPGYEKLLQSDYFVDLTETSRLGLLNERSWHAVGGVERDFGRALTARVEAYYKTFDRLLVGRLETPEETAVRTSQYAFPGEFAASVPSAPEVTTIPSNGASGRSFGLDMYLEKRARTTTDRVTGWIAYTLGRATIDNYGRTYAFDYDRRHSVSVVSTLALSRRWSLGTTLRMASGFPETTPVGVVVGAMRDETLPEGAPGSLVPARDPAGLPVWTIDYGGAANLNGARLPIYARLDVRMTYTRSPTSRWQLYFELLNAFDRENAAALVPHLEYSPTGDRPIVTTDRDQGLPRLPSFGLRTRF